MNVNLPGGTSQLKSDGTGFQTSHSNCNTNENGILIQPKPSFVLKTYYTPHIQTHTIATAISNTNSNIINRTKNNKRKVLINITTHPLIAIPKTTKKLDPTSGNEVEGMNLPLALGPLRHCMDKSGVVCVCVDAVIHSSVLDGSCVKDGGGGGVGDAGTRDFVCHVIMTCFDQKYGNKEDGLNADGHVNIDTGLNFGMDDGSNLNSTGLGLGLNLPSSSKTASSSSTYTFGPLDRKYKLPNMKYFGYMDFATGVIVRNKSDGHGKKMKVEVCKQYVRDITKSKPMIEEVDKKSSSSPSPTTTLTPTPSPLSFDISIQLKTGEVMTVSEFINAVHEDSFSDPNNSSNENNHSTSTRSECCNGLSDGYVLVDANNDNVANTDDALVRLVTTDENVSDGMDNDSDSIGGFWDGQILPREWHGDLPLLMDCAHDSKNSYVKSISRVLVKTSIPLQLPVRSGLDSPSPSASVSIATRIQDGIEISASAYELSISPSDKSNDGNSSSKSSLIFGKTVHKLPFCIDTQEVECECTYSYTGTFNNCEVNGKRSLYNGEEGEVHINISCAVLHTNMDDCADIGSPQWLFAKAFNGTTTRNSTTRCSLQKEREQGESNTSTDGREIGKDDDDDPYHLKSPFPWKPNPEFISNRSSVSTNNEINGMKQKIERKLPEDQFHAKDSMSQHWIQQQEKERHEKIRNAENDRMQREHDAAKGNGEIEYIVTDDYRPGGKYCQEGPGQNKNSNGAQGQKHKGVRADAHYEDEEHENGLRDARILIQKMCQEFNYHEFVCKLF